MHSRLNEGLGEHMPFLASLVIPFSVYKMDKPKFDSFAGLKFSALTSAPQLLLFH